MAHCHNRSRLGAKRLAIGFKPASVMPCDFDAVCHEQRLPGFQQLVWNGRPARQLRPNPTAGTVAGDYGSQLTCLRRAHKRSPPAAFFGSSACGTENAAVFRLMSCRVHNRRFELYRRAYWHRGRQPRSLPYKPIRRTNLRSAAAFFRRWRKKRDAGAPPSCHLSWMLAESWGASPRSFCARVSAGLTHQGS